MANGDFEMWDEMNIGIEKSIIIIYRSFKVGSLQNGQQKSFQIWIKLQYIVFQDNNL